MEKTPIFLVRFSRRRSKKRCVIKMQILTIKLRKRDDDTVSIAWEHDMDMIIRRFCASAGLELNFFTFLEIWWLFKQNLSFPFEILNTEIHFIFWGFVFLLHTIINLNKNVRSDSETHFNYYLLHKQRHIYKFYFPPTSQLTTKTHYQNALGNLEI